MFNAWAKGKKVKGEGDCARGKDRRPGAVLAAEYSPYSRNPGGPEREHRRSRQRHGRAQAGRAAIDPRCRTIASDRAEEPRKGNAARHHCAFYDPQYEGRRHAKRAQTQRHTALRQRGFDESSLNDRLGSADSEAAEQGGRHVDARRHRVREGRRKLG